MKHYSNYHDFSKISEDFFPFLKKHILHYRVDGLDGFKAVCQKALDEFCDTLGFDDIPNTENGEPSGLSVYDTDRYEPHYDDEMTAMFNFRGGLYGYLTAYWLKDNEGKRYITEISDFLPD